MVNPVKLTYEQMNRPEGLRKLLNAIDDQLDEIRTLANELKTDHATSRTAVSNVNSALKAMAFNDGGLTASTTPTKLKIANAVNYLIGGAPYKKSAATSIAFTASSHDLAAGKYAYYLVSLNASGSLAITMGTAVSSASSAAIPSLPSSQAPVGLVYGKGGTSGFDATTDSVSSASGLTSAAFYPLLVHPGTLSDPPATVGASSISDYVTGGR